MEYKSVEDPREDKCVEDPVEYKAVEEDPMEYKAVPSATLGARASAVYVEHEQQQQGEEEQPSSILRRAAYGRDAYGEAFERWARKSRAEQRSRAAQGSSEASEASEKAEEKVSEEAEQEEQERAPRVLHFSTRQKTKAAMAAAVAEAGRGLGEEHVEEEGEQAQAHLSVGGEGGGGSDWNNGGGGGGGGGFARLSSDAYADAVEVQDHAFAGLGGFWGAGLGLPSLGKGFGGGRGAAQGAALARSPAAVAAAAAVVCAVGRCKLKYVVTHSLKATGFKPLPLNINPGFKMCLSNATCATTARRCWRWARRSAGAPPPPRGVVGLRFGNAGATLRRYRSLWFENNSLQCGWKEERRFGGASVPVWDSL
jgi:hypothetical protein